MSNVYSICSDTLINFEHVLKNNLVSAYKSAVTLKRMASAYASVRLQTLIQGWGTLSNDKAYVSYVPNTLTYVGVRFVIDRCSVTARCAHKDSR